MGAGGSPPSLRPLMTLGTGQVVACLWNWREICIPVPSHVV